MSLYVCNCAYMGREIYFLKTLNLSVCITQRMFHGLIWGDLANQHHTVTGGAMTDVSNKAGSVPSL